MTTAYPIIANCNYESADDTTIHQIRKAVDNGLTDDADLLVALSALEETLSEHAESDSLASTRACKAAERDVLAAWSDDVQAAVNAEQIARYQD